MGPHSTRKSLNGKAETSGKVEASVRNGSWIGPGSNSLIKAPFQNVNLGLFRFEPMRTCLWPQPSCAACSVSCTENSITKRELREAFNYENLIRWTSVGGESNSFVHSVLGFGNAFLGV